LNDTSTGVDSSVTSRRIYLTLYNEYTLGSDGVPIAPDTTTPYIVWPIADASITLPDILTRDWAVNIVVEWITPTPDPDNTYEYEILTSFTAYTMVFLGQLLTQKNARYPNIVNNSDFNENEAELYTEVASANNAVTILQNIYLSQIALDRAYYMMQQNQFFFV